MLFVIPTYNEMDNIHWLLESIWKHFSDSDVLVVDDASPDGTGEWCLELANTEPRLFCMVRHGERGIGSATLAGLRWGLDRGDEWLVTLDGDGSHSPADLQPVAERLDADEAQLWIGSRYCPGGQIENWKWHRRWISRCVNRTAQVVLRVPVRDYSSAFRAYHRSALLQLDWDDIHAQGYAYLEELLVKLHRRGVSIREFPIRFRDRRAGQSKAGLGESIRALSDLLKLFRSSNR